MFQPKFSITEVDQNSRYLIIRDATLPYNAVTNPGGYGTPGGPVDVSAIRDIQIQVQLLGQLPALVPYLNLSGVIGTGFKATYNLQDGVNLIHALYGFSVGSSFTIVPDYNTKIVSALSGAAFENAWKGVTYVSDSLVPGKLYKVKSIDYTLGTVDLYTPFIPSGNVSYVLKYYEDIEKTLVLNCGKNKLIKDISNMSLSVECCDNDTSMGLLERMMLEQAATISYNCGNLAKANQAAQLFCNRKLKTQGCNNC